MGSSSLEIVTTKLVRLSNQFERGIITSDEFTLKVLEVVSDAIARLGDSD